MARPQSPERIVGLNTEDSAVEFLREEFKEQVVVPEGVLGKMWDPSGRIKVKKNHITLEGHSYGLPDALIFEREPGGMRLVKVVEIKHKHFQEEDTKKAKGVLEIFRDIRVVKLLKTVLKQGKIMRSNLNNLTIPETDVNCVLGVVSADGEVDSDVTAEIKRLPQTMEEIKKRGGFSAGRG